VLMRVTAINSPSKNDRAIDTTDSSIVTLIPDTIHSKYCPEVTIAQSKL